jgi:hypothetical protein
MRYIRKALQYLSMASISDLLFVFLFGAVFWLIFIWILFKAVLT